MGERYPELPQLRANEDLSAHEDSRKSASVASCPTGERGARIESDVRDGGAAGGLCATGHHEWRGSCAAARFVPLTFPGRGFLWETRPQLVHGIISSTVAVRASALSTRCCGATGKCPRGTWAWSRRSDTRRPPKGSSNRR